MTQTTRTTVTKGALADPWRSSRSLGACST